MILSEFLLVEVQRISIRMSEILEKKVQQGINVSSVSESFTIVGADLVRGSSEGVIDQKPRKQECSDRGREM